MSIFDGMKLWVGHQIAELLGAVVIMLLLGGFVVIMMLLATAEEKLTRRGKGSGAKADKTQKGHEDHDGN